MDHPYSAWADLLSKFQGSPPGIQALWLVLVAAVALGVVWCVTDLLKSVLGGRRRLEPHRDEPGPRVIHGIVEDGEGRWVVYENGVAMCVRGRGEDFAGDLVRAGERARLPLQR